MKIISDSTSSVNNLFKFLTHLHRGGSWSYWWIKPEDKSFWWPANKPSKPPRHKNLYFGVHPINKQKGEKQRAFIDDIAAVNCLYADFDAKHFSNSKSDTLAHAINVNPSILVDTGGGYQGYWLLDSSFIIRNNFDRERAKKLQEGWVDFVKGDPGAKSLNQILRVPGSRNYKKEYSPDYPIARFMKTDFDLLFEFEELEERIRKKGVLQKQGSVIEEGYRNSYLTSQAGKMVRKGMFPDWIDASLLWDNQKYCNPPLDATEVLKIAKSVSKYSLEKNETGKIAQIMRLEDVIAEEVSWLWEPYIPLGKLTLLEGDPGIGKTWMALQIAAMVSSGQSFPSTNKKTSLCEPKNVVYLSAEDGVGDTIKPRLKKADADQSRIFVLTGWKDTCLKTNKETRGQVILTDIDVLEQAIENLSPAILIIDPLQAYLGSKVDMHRANETRPVLAGLAMLAEKYHCAVLCIRHLAKSHTEKSIYRGLGSIDFSAAARSILLAGQDPQDKDKRVLAHVKSSLAAIGPSLCYEIREDGFRWLGISEHCAETLLATSSGEKMHSALQKAIEFLKLELSQGSRRTKTIFSKAEEIGLSEKTIRRAGKDIDVNAHKFGGKGGFWVWELKK